MLNLHVDHTPQAIEDAAETFRELIDVGIAYGGSYYLIYHRWARKDQKIKSKAAIRRCANSSR